jgi:RecB family exonuclease
MITKLVDYLSKFHAEGGRVIGSEVPFTFDIAGAHVHGKVDRIEITPSGEIYIADLKTSKYKVTKEELATHPQLGVYQLAAMAERFDKYPETQSNPKVAGAKLIEVGGDGKDPVSIQGSLTTDIEARENLEQLLNQITHGMIMENQSLVAKVSDHCTSRYGFGSCSLHLIEQVSYGR